MNANMASENKKDELCAVCQSVTKQKCGNCKIVYYCSREHQKEDWKTHSKNCCVYKLVEDPTFGRRYVAMRNIETDEFVIREDKALVVVPMTKTKPICLNCYASLTIDKAKPCNNCGWPLCLNCTKHGPECELTMKYRKSKVNITSFSEPNILYDSITVMRVLALQQQNPDAYEKLMSLEDHRIEMMQNSIGDGSLSANIIALHLTLFMKFDVMDLPTIARILGIVMTNGIISRHTDIKNIAVFEKPPNIEHNCHPNCRRVYYYDANNGARMIVQAITTIPKEHPITIARMSPLLGTTERRKLLRERKFIECICERCTDPTEFGTMFSAVKCFAKECNGFMLPRTFLVSKNEKVPNFVCNKCHLESPSATIDEIDESMLMEFSKIDLNNENQLKEFIDNKKKIVHENHFRIIEAECWLLRAFYVKDRNLTLASDELLKEYGKLCDKLIRQYEIISPHYYDRRAKFQYLKYRFLVKPNLAQCFRNEIKFLRLSEECKKALTECYRLARHEPKDQDGTSLADFAQIQLKGEISAFVVALPF